MFTLSAILTETNKMLQLSAQFSAEYLETQSEKSPAIAAPDTGTKQGEQKIPMVKPNGVSK